MKIKSIAILALAALALLLLAAILLLYTTPGFDLRQRIKYPAYYSWRAGSGPFDERTFWIGLATDRHREQIFLGKTAKEIQQMVPILIPSEQISDPHFMQLKGSDYTLQFDDSGRCIRFYLNKG
ncbi:hypothetical protein BH09VER1_BH09VER1_55480 [soil metagenome]